MEPDPVAAPEDPLPLVAADDDAPDEPELPPDEAAVEGELAPEDEVEVVAVVDVQPYLGQVVQFALTTSLPVVRGETIALTTPTWAPVLSIDLSTAHFAYRQSRSRNCNHPPATSQAQVTVGQSTPYVCDYPGTRVEYSATEVTTPVPTAPPSSTTPTKKK